MVVTRASSGAPPLQGGQRRELARQAAVPADLELADRQRRAALGVGEQVLVAPPVLDGDVLRLRRPRPSSGRRRTPRRRAIAGGKKIDAAAAVDERLDQLGRVALGQRGLPEQQRDVLPLDRRQLVGRDHLGRALERGVGSDRGGQLQAAGRPAASSATTTARRGAGWSKTKQKSLSAGFASAGIETLPQPRSRPRSSGMRWSFSSNCGPAISTVTSDRAPSISNWTGIELPGVRRPFASEPQRDEQLRAVAGLLAADVGHADRQVAGGGLGIGEQVEPDALRELEERVAQRPASGRSSAFQSFSRRSEQIQTSVRPGLLARM